MLTDEKWKKFVDTFAALFGGLTALDGKDVWFEFVSGANWDTLKTILAEIAEFQAKSGEIKKPKLATVAWHYGKARKRDGSGESYSPKYECGLCRSQGENPVYTGWLKGVYSYGMDKFIYPSDWDGKQYAIRMVPCSCHNGDQHAGGIASPTREWLAQVAFKFSLCDWEILDRLQSYRAAGSR